MLHSTKYPMQYISANKTGRQGFPDVKSKTKLKFHSLSLDRKLYRSPKNNIHLQITNIENKKKKKKKCSIKNLKNRHGKT